MRNPLSVPTENKVVGFVSGCFDWMAPAHVILFEKAKERCDELHVLVADDLTVQHFKGVGRPLLRFSHRLILYESCRYVDHVHKFHKIPPVNNQRDIIEKINPSIYFEGMDATDVYIGEYLEEFGIERVQLETMALHVSDILREYDVSRYDQTRQEYFSLSDVAGL